MIKIQNLIRQVILFAIFCLVNTSFVASQVMVADTFFLKLKATSKPQLIDVRTPSEFGGGHLVAAKNINVKDSDFINQIEKLDKNQPVFVYCLSGGRSKTAAEMFASNGFTQIYELKGGYLNWSAAKMPTEGTPIAPLNENRISLAELKKNIAENKLVLVDFFATWCGPCKLMDPKIKRLQTTYGQKVKIIKVDTDKNKTVAIQQLVSELPTFIFYKNGKEFWRGVGEQDEDFLSELFDLNLGK